MRYFLLIIGFSLCQNSFAQKLKPVGEYKKRADEMFEKVWKLYRVPAHPGLFSEHYPAGEKVDLDYFQGAGVKEKEVSFLWPFSGMFSAANVLIRHQEFRSRYQKYLDTLAIGIWKYRDTTRTPIGYQAYPASLEPSDRYYDDNGLVCIDYAEAYLNTSNPEFIRKGKEVFEFIIGGWDENLGGGVYWLEGHKDQKPACSNGMATLSALKLYQATGENKYLEWGKRFYKWMHSRMRNPDGIYFNDVKMDGKPNPTYYTYNTGAMLESAMLLYKFTREASYFKEAQLVAKNSLRFFSKQELGVRRFNVDLPWFLTVLFRGYESLYHVDKNPEYIKAILIDLDRAWENAADRNGLLSAKWATNQNALRKPKWLLDEACIAELYARASLLNLAKKSK